MRPDGTQVKLGWMGTKGTTVAVGKRHLVAENVLQLSPSPDQVAA
jgi:hypothetical protein